jgi:Reverse transcriptase (RNA-dependent DNA polymerase)
VYEIAKDLEVARVLRRLHRVFSYRVKRNAEGQLYDPECNFDTFQDQLKEECAANPSSWTVVADIADFYSRIYHHRLENNLSAATGNNRHVTAIMSFLSQWAFSVSYGLPVGPAATRILAEVTLADVDSALTAEGIRFCRFSDDYRLFASSEGDARRSLAILAEVLHENHGMTLNDQKTDILPASDFARYHLNGSSHSSPGSLATRIRKILREYDVDDDPYQDLSTEDLPEEVLAALDDLDLNAVITEQVQARLMDNIAASTALRRLAQLRDARSLDVVLDKTDRLTPVLKQVTYYLAKVVPSEERSRIGHRLLDMIRSGVNCHLEFQRSWLLSLFAEDDSWNCRDELVPLLNQEGYSRGK